MKLWNDFMKKLLIVVLLAVCGVSAKAQIIYQSFTNGQTQQAQVQTVRATAYCVDYYGNLNKLPIKVEIQTKYNLTYMYVVEYYQNNGIQGYWYKIATRPQVSECMPAYTQNPLEKRFMYKVFLNQGWYYFDL